MNCNSRFWMVLVELFGFSTFQILLYTSRPFDLCAGFAVSKLLKDVVRSKKLPYFKFHDCLTRIANCLFTGLLKSPDMCLLCVGAVVVELSNKSLGK